MFLLLIVLGACIFRTPGRLIGRRIGEVERGTLGWLGSFLGAALSGIAVYHEYIRTQPTAVVESALFWAAIVATTIELLMLTFAAFLRFATKRVIRFTILHLFIVTTIVAICSAWPSVIAVAILLLLPLLPFFLILRYLWLKWMKGLPSEHAVTSYEHLITLPTSDSRSAESP